MLSNYTIKQALPRLIIAAIAINLSYFLCALLVDASNLVGASLFKVLQSVGAQALDATSIDTIVTAILSAGAVGVTAGGVGAIAAVLVTSVTGAGSAVATGAALMLLSVLLGIVLALFIGLMVLIARQALIIILVVVSPIAFALFVLPGTKSLFDKWRKLFTTMLVFYPAFSLLYGGSLVAASILIAASNSSGSNAPTQMNAIFLIMGMAIQFIPLFLTPWLIMNASGKLGEFGQRLMQKGKNLTSGIANAGKNRMKEGASLAAQTHMANARKWAAGSGRNTRRGRLVNALGYGKAKRESQRKRNEGVNTALDEQFRTNSPTMQRLYDETAASGLDAEGHKDVQKRASFGNQAVRNAHTARVHADLNKSLTEEELEDEAKLKHIGNSETNELYLRRAAAGAEKDQAEAEKGQLIDELKTKRGRERRGYIQGAGNERLADVAKRLGDASSDKHLADEATRSAGRQLVTEQAQHLINNANAAATAGGIEEYGQQRAVAVAKNTLERQFDEKVGWEKSAITSVGEPALISRAVSGIDENGQALSAEARVAAAGTVAGRGNMGAKLELLRQLNAEMIAVATPVEQRIKQGNAQQQGESDRDYQDRIDQMVDTELVNNSSLDALRYMQMQVMSDMKEAPFAVSDRMIGGMKRGVGRVDVDQSFKSRLNGKLKASAIQSLKPEEMDWIEKAFAQGFLGTEHAAAIQAAVDDMRASSDTVANTKKETKTFIDKLVAAGHLSTGI